MGVRWREGRLSHYECEGGRGVRLLLNHTVNTLLRWVPTDRVLRRRSRTYRCSQGALTYFQSPVRLAASAIKNSAKVE